MEWLFVCYSLQRENWMVEVGISWTIMCQGSHDGFLLSLWVFVEGFNSVWTCWSSPHSLVIILGRIWCYGFVVYDLNHLWSLHLFLHLVVGLFYVIGICTVGYGGYYAKRIALGLVYITWDLHLYQNYSNFWGKTRGLCPCVFLCWLLDSKKPLHLCIVVYPIWCELSPYIAS